MHPENQSLNPLNPFVVQCEAARETLNAPIPLRELIRDGGFIFAMCGLVVLAILTAVMGFQSW